MQEPGVLQYQCHSATMLVLAFSHHLLFIRCCTDPCAALYASAIRALAL